MTVHLLHGFNVRDGGARTTARWAGAFEDAGYTAVPHDLGLIGLVDLRCRNRALVDELLPLVQPGDTVVAHSNGCLIAWLLVEAGAKPSTVVCVNAALRRDTRWPDTLPVLNLHSSADDVLLFARLWRRLAVSGHGWGAAGRYGFGTASGKQVCNVDMAEKWWEYPARGHSDAFKEPAWPYWAEHTAQWVKSAGCSEAPGPTSLRCETPTHT